MATWVVKQDGSGDFANLTDAFANVAMVASDIIEIQDTETYSEGNLSRVLAGLTIKAASGFTPILDGGGTIACAIKFYNNWIIDGLTITNYTGASLGGAGLVSVSDFRTVVIKNCTLYDLEDTAIYGLGDGSIVENCKIYDIHTLSSARGIDAGLKSITVKNCLIYDIIDEAIRTTGSSTIIEHCTVYNINYDAGSYGVFASLGTVRYCIVSDPSHNIADSALRASSHSYNCVSGSEDSSSGNFYDGTSTGDIESDPLLVSGSFTLSPGSPCVGAATGSSMTGSLDGISREWEYSHSVLGVSSAGHPNMGCFDTPSRALGVNTQDISSIMGVSD